MNRIILLSLAAILAWSVGAPSRAEAHAHLKSASPPIDSTVRSAKAVSITFTEAVEPAFSSIVVQDTHGQQVDAGDLHAASKDGLKLEIGLKPLTPGTYTVVWHATSVDTHKTDGHFSFTVKP